MTKVSGNEELALAIKVADRLANVLACIHNHHIRLFVVQRKEQADFYQAAFRQDRCDVLWTKLE